MALVAKKDLQKGKVYFFSNLRNGKGVFEGVNDKDELIFTPLVLGPYTLNSDGFVNFEQEMNGFWLEDNETV